MHKQKATARKSAWYDAEGDTPIYNPFAKIRRRKNVQSGIAGTVSESGIRPLIELERRSQQREGLQTTKHARTFPPSDFDSVNSAFQRDSIQHPVVHQESIESPDPSQNLPDQNISIVERDSRPVDEEKGIVASDKTTLGSTIRYVSQRWRWLKLKALPAHEHDVRRTSAQIGTQFIAHAPLSTDGRYLLQNTPRKKRVLVIDYDKINRSNKGALGNGTAESFC